MAKKIMIIDDASSMRQVISLTLKGGGYDFIEAGDGLEALEKLKGEEVDMFICDVNMPNMDGLTFLEEVRKGDSHKFTPFIMLTTEIGKEVREKGKTLGANAWVVKPFNPEQLLDAVKKLIN